MSILQFSSSLVTPFLLPFSSSYLYMFPERDSPSFFENHFPSIPVTETSFFRSPLHPTKFQLHTYKTLEFVNQTEIIWSYSFNSFTRFIHYYPRGQTFLIRLTIYPSSICPQSHYSSLGRLSITSSGSLCITIVTDPTPYTLIFLYL